MAACFGCAAFGTVSGDSVSTTLTLGKIAIPEMQKSKYDIKLAIGSIASAAPIAAMIPPSALMCMYGFVVQQSMGKLLMGGVLPGILTAVIFAITVGIWAHLKPDIAPRTQEKISWKDKFVSLKNIWIVAICALFILGGIYTGVFTPTEAGGISALVVLLSGIAAKRLNLKKIWDAVIDSSKITGTVTVIMAGALMFNAMFTLTGVTEDLVDFLTPEGVSPMLVLIGIMTLYLILGFFMNAVAMLFLTMPFVFPIITDLGINPIWFGIMVVHMCEVGSITPPFGITLFVVRTIVPKETTSATILIGVLPFFFAYLVVLAIMLAFPQIALFLPSMMT
jgi:tripartite ATP-independent transporter DctM subunit